jgi:hypothetical protein
MAKDLKGVPKPPMPLEKRGKTEPIIEGGKKDTYIEPVNEWPKTQPRPKDSGAGGGKK